MRRLDIEATFERERSKLDHQRETMRSLDPRETLFVWSNVQNNLARSRMPGGVYGEGDRAKFTLRADEWARLTAALDGFMGAPCRTVAFATPVRDPDGAAVHLEPGASGWKGEDGAWDAALERRCRDTFGNG